MQSRCVAVASRGRENARCRLQHAVARSCAPQRGNKRRLCLGPTWNSHRFADEESTSRRCYHSTPPFQNNRPIHMSFPRESPISAALATNEKGHDDMEAFDGFSMDHYILDDTPPNDTGHEDSWAYSSSPSTLDYDIREASLWDESYGAHSLEQDVTSENLYREPATPARKLSAHEMIQNFDPYNPPKKENLEEMQLWLEVQAQQESVSKYDKIVQDARERKDFASLGIVQKQVLRWYQALKEEIEQEQKRYFTEKLVDIPVGLRTYGPYLCSLQPEKLAVIAAHVALIQCMLRADAAPVLVVAKKIGTAVECEVNVQRALWKVMEESRKQMQEDWESAEGVAVDDSRHENADEPDSVHGWMYGTSHLRKFVEESNGVGGTKNNKGIYSINRRARRILNIKEHWNEGDKIKLGVALLEMLLNTATLNIKDREEEKAFVYEKRVDMSKAKWGRKQGVVSLHEELYEMLVKDKSKSFAAMTDRYKPMVLPPRDWKGPSDGAYSWLKVNLMRTEDCNTQMDALRNGDLTKAYDGLNALGRVPWVINKTVLSAAQHCWENDIALGDIPSRTDFQLPPKPEELDRTNWIDDTESDAYKEQGEQLRAYRDAYSRFQRIRQKNMDLRSLRCSAILKLDQAEQFKDFDEIYFPYNMDFRGRAYPVPPHLSTVGSDMCRGILKFAKPKPLGDRGLYWLKVHLANLAGNDKLSFDGRVGFTEENMENIRAAVNDPFGENQWWMRLDDPFQGLATCHEIVNAIDSGDPASYECALPVHMDGSCNGLQHYAALGRDREGGRAVNLCKSDKPSDVYLGVKDEVVKRVAMEASITLGFDDSKWDDLDKSERDQLKRNRSAKLVDGLIDRGVVKRTVMTSVYGVTYIGARNQIQEKIVEKLEDKGYDVYENESKIHEACGYLASVTMEVMGDLFSGARQTMNWLATCARLIAQQGQPVSWFSPIGIPAVQPYRQKKLATIQTVLQSVVLVDQHDELPVHKGRQATAFPPNYVHSIDASHMILTALEMEKRGLTFSAVHDSFWTHPCDVDEMNDALREAFVDLHEQPLLESLKETWKLCFPSIGFPELPEKGDLDLNEVKSAQYFFQ